jgi:hypothetical protein
MLASRNILQLAKLEELEPILEDNLGRLVRT